MTPQIIRSDSSITVIIDGSPFAVSRDDHRYQELDLAIQNQDWETVRKVTAGTQQAVEVLQTYGKVEVFNGHIKLNGKPCHNYVAQKILEAQAGGYPVEAMSRFLDRVFQSPSYRVVNDLFKWLEASRMPLLDDGRFLAFKMVRSNYFDLYSGTMDNSPGLIIEMPRNEVNEDPTQTCSAGLHFCGPGYLKSYSQGERLLLLAVAPEDVVAFPNDYHLHKGRACRYESVQAIPWEDQELYTSGRPFELKWGYKPSVRDHVVINKDTLLYWSNGENGTPYLSSAKRFTKEEAEFADLPGIIVHQDEAEELRRSLEPVYIRDSRDGEYVEIQGASFAYRTSAEPVARKIAEAFAAERPQLSATWVIVRPGEGFRPDKKPGVEPEKFYVLDRTRDFVTDETGAYISEFTFPSNRPWHTRAEADRIVQDYSGDYGPCEIVSVADYEAEAETDEDDLIDLDD